MNDSSTVSIKSVRYVTREIVPRYPGEQPVYDRFTRIPGANQQALRQAKIMLIGCGGLGSECGHGLIRKGVGELYLCDHDTVELSNLSRQKFNEEDLGKNKALCLAHNLAREATARSLIVGRAVSFQELAKSNINTRCSLAIVGVDNNITRVYVAQHYFPRRIPVIFTAVDRNACKGYVFVQESKPGTPCFLCLFPDAKNDRSIEGCTGASIDILKVMAGIVLYAVDSLLMDRPRNWNYKEVHLDGGHDGHYIVRQRKRCPLCNER
ncbi:MAG: ThiF family adenylyltransferase [Anaerolineae bacterium]